MPYRRAFEQGCDRVVVILTKPRSFIRKPEKLLPLIQRRYREYPNFCRTMEERPERDNRGRAELFQLEKEGKALVIAPNTLHGVGRIEHNVDKLRMLWAEGYQQGMERMEIRFAASVERLREARRRIDVLLCGTDNEIPELEETLSFEKGPYLYPGFIRLSHSALV